MLYWPNWSRVFKLADSIEKYTNPLSTQCLYNLMTSYDYRIEFVILVSKEAHPFIFPGYNDAKVVCEYMHSMPSIQLINMIL